MFEIELRIEPSKEKSIETAIDVGDALNEIFTYPVDSVILKISHQVIELPICHVFSELIEDFLTMISEVNATEYGSGIYGLSLGNLHDSDWHLEWSKDGELFIRFDWRSVKGIEDIRMLPKSIKTTKPQFIEQWKAIFREFKQHIDHVIFEHESEYLEITNLIGKT